MKENIRAAAEECCGLQIAVHHLFATREGLPLNVGRARNDMGFIINFCILPSLAGGNRWALRHV
jgi:hypothetical protein